MRNIGELVTLFWTLNFFLFVLDIKLPVLANSEDRVAYLHLDFGGTHALVSTKAGENIYVNVPKHTSKGLPELQVSGLQGRSQKFLWRWEQWRTQGGGDQGGPVPPRLWENFLI